MKKTIFFIAMLVPVFLVAQVNRPSSTGSGTVTSVAMTTPTGLTVSGSPITTTGTLGVSLTSGYSIPTTANQTNWTAGYNDKVNSLGFTGTATKTLTLTQQDAGTVTGTFSDIGFANPMTTAGDIIYYGAAGTTRLAAGTQNYVLKMGATYPEWAAESVGDTSFFDLSGTTITTKAGATNLTVSDTITGDVLNMNKIGTGTYDVNINGELYTDSAYIDSLFVNADLRGGAYFLVSDGSGSVTTLLDTTGAFTQGSGGGTSYWELDGLSLINDTANSDTVRVPDGILGLGALNVNSGKILFRSSVDVGYDFNVYNSYGRLSTNSATLAIAGNRGIYNGSTGDAIFRPNYTENTGIGSDSKYETTVVVDGHEVLTADTLGVTITDILRIAPRAAAPSSPSEGWIYSNSTDHHLYFYNGSTWVQLD